MSGNINSKDMTLNIYGIIMISEAIRWRTEGKYRSKYSTVHPE
jgi:hypothetical protein